MRKVLVTGGAGFIGSNYVRHLLTPTDLEVVNLDLLTYAGNLENLKDVDRSPRYAFVKGDVADRAAVEAAFLEHRPDAVVHFAAESHVDRSVLDATPFVRTNVLGTQVLLDVSRARGISRFVHVSTDEVYGSLGPSAEAAQSFAEALRLHLKLPVHLWDERLTTLAAERALLGAGLRRKARRAVVDQVAATMILQGFLDRLEARRRQGAP